MMEIQTGKHTHRLNIGITKRTRAALKIKANL